MSIDLKGIDWKAQLFPARDDLPRDLTSYDILKSFAVVLMIVDHVGWLIFPQIEWFRVAGRLCVPVWFFLIGYADTRDVPWRWYVAGVVLLVSSLLVGLEPLPVCILFTFALIRKVIEPFWAFIAARPVYFWWICLLLAFFSYVSDMLVEYGTMGLLLALTGYVARHREAVEADMGGGFVQTFTIVALAMYGVVESLSFGFDLFGVMVLAAGLIGVFFALHDFTPKVMAGTGAGAHAPLIRFMGRYTLEIYVIHLLVLKGVFGLQKLAATIL